MKKLLLLLFVLLLMLPGCTTEPDYEQLQDVYLPVTVPVGQLQLMLPGEATVFAMGQETDDRLYFCDGYTLSLQTAAAGDLSRTIEAMTGYQARQLTILQTEQNGLDCYECVWSCLGEGGEQVGRLLLLDDGAYHYVVTVMADADEAGGLREAWDQIFDSVSLSYTGQ